MFTEALEILSNPAHAIAEGVYAMMEVAVGYVLGRFFLRRHDQKHHGIVKDHDAPRSGIPLGSAGPYG